METVNNEVVPTPPVEESGEAQVPDAVGAADVDANGADALATEVSAPVVSVEASAPPAAVEGARGSSLNPSGHYPSLYDSVGTTFVAIIFGIAIVGGIQVAVARIFMRERNPHRALTQFVTAMVAIMVGVYVSDMLIAGPTAQLLAESERTSILGFVKDTALMIFAYYFGTQSTGQKESDA